MLHGIRTLSQERLAELAFEAYQRGMTATHDACIKESLRRQFTNEHPTIELARRFAVVDHDIMYGDGTLKQYGGLFARGDVPKPPLPPSTMTRQRRRYESRKGA